MSAVPYSHALGDRDPVRVLEATAGALSLLVERAKEKVGEDAPLAEGKWSLRQLLAHLADCEIAWAWRLRQALGSEQAVIQPFDQDAWARMYTRTYTLAEAQRTLFALRGWNLAFLHALKDEERTRPVTHPERGEETLWTIAQIMAGHDLHHLRILEEQLRAAEGKV